MIFYLPLILAILCLALSMLASFRNPHHETQLDVVTRHGGSIEAALWAIAFLLIWIGLR